jgi:hypothetical protein
MLSKGQISEILAYLLADAGRELRPEKLQVWHDQFSDLDYKTAWRAAKHLNAKGFKEWEPRTHEFRESLAMVTETTQLSGSEAFNLALQAVQRFGQYNEQGAIDSLPNRAALALQRYGYRELCLAPEAMQGVQRAQFAKIYDSIRAREDFSRTTKPELSGQILQSLPGISKILGGAK